MRYFSVPSDFKFETIDRYTELNNMYSESKVIETYGQVTSGTLLNSGRVISVLPQIDFKGLEEYIKYSKTNNIEFNYTLNPACFGNKEFTLSGIQELKTLLQQLEQVGVTSLTVTSPPLMELIQQSVNNFKLKASAICEITSPNKALFYKNLGTGRIVIDPDITRNFNAIRNICKAFGDGVEIIINNMCYKDCAYKMFHYNHEAHCTDFNNKDTIQDYYFNRCSMQKAGSVSNYVRLNWIRPEDISFYYEAGIRYFKIQGRQSVIKGNIVKTVRHYFDMEYDGNLLDLITLYAPYNAFQPYLDNKKLDGFIESFYNNPGLCSGICSQCGYCDQYAHKSVEWEAADQLNKHALNFYKGYDTYSKHVKKSEDPRLVQNPIDNECLNIDFNL